MKPVKLCLDASVLTDDNTYLERVWTGPLLPVQALVTIAIEQGYYAQVKEINIWINDGNPENDQIDIEIEFTDEFLETIAKSDKANMLNDLVNLAGWKVCG